MSFLGMVLVAVLIGVGIAAVAAYVIFQILVGPTKARVLRLERELALIRASQDDKQARLNEIFLAVTGMQRSTEERLSNIREKIDQYFAIQNVH